MGLISTDSSAYALLGSDVYGRKAVSVSLSWVTVVSTALLTTNDPGWNGYTTVCRWESAQLSNTGLANVRVTLNAGTGEGAAFDGVYIGMAAASGDAYDFEATPTQLLFSGSGSVLVPNSGTVVSDTTVFSVQASKALLVSAHFSSSANDNVMRSTGSIAGWSSYYKAAVSEAATVDKTTYTTYAQLFIVSLVESAA